MLHLSKYLLKVQRDNFDVTVISKVNIVENLLRQNLANQQIF